MHIDRYQLPYIHPCISLRIVSDLHSVIYIYIRAVSRRLTVFLKPPLPPANRQNVFRCPAGPSGREIPRCEGRIQASLLAPKGEVREDEPGRCENFSNCKFAQQLCPFRPATDQAIAQEASRPPPLTPHPTNDSRHELGKFANLVGSPIQESRSQLMGVAQQQPPSRRGARKGDRREAHRHFRRPQVQVVCAGAPRQRCEVVRGWTGLLLGKHFLTPARALS